MKYLNRKSLKTIGIKLVTRTVEECVELKKVVDALCLCFGRCLVAVTVTCVGVYHYETLVGTNPATMHNVLESFQEPVKWKKMERERMQKEAAVKLAKSENPLDRSERREVLGLSIGSEILAKKPLKKAVLIEEKPLMQIVSKSYRHQPTLDEVKQWPVTTIRETKGEVSWDEQQFFQFYGPTVVGPLRMSDEMNGYQGVTELKPFHNEKARRHDKRPVMMLKRVLFTEDLLGKWEVVAADSEEAGNRNQGDGCWVEFLSHHRYRENQVRCEKDQLFGEEWLLEFELVGTWVVKPELRTIMVYVEDVKLKQRQGWSEAAATDLKLKLRGLSQWEIETVAEEGIEIDPGEDLRFTLVKMD